MSTTFPIAPSGQQTQQTIKIIWLFARLDGTVQLDGDLTLLGTILSPTGFIEDAGGGTIHVGGGGSGSLSVASGYEALLSGNVEVSGSGTLELDFLNGYTPTSGTTFPVLTAASLGAHFDTTPANMTANYTSTGVSVTEN